MPDLVVFPNAGLSTAEQEPAAMRLGGTFRLPRPAVTPPADPVDVVRIRMGGTFRI